MASQGRYEMEIDSGASYRMQFAPYLDDEPYDLDGATFRMYVRDDRRIQFAEYTLAVEHDDEIGTDVVTIELTPTETAKYFPHRRYYFVIDMTHPSDDVERILDGPLRVRPFTGGVHHGRAA